MATSPPAVGMDVQAALDELTQAEGVARVPGVALGILERGEVEVYASGIAHPAHGSAVTPDTLFRIASISKLWTATLVMQLVDEGKIDLDAPLAEQLPGFRLKDEAAGRRVTPRHLLSHTSGIPGDFGFDGGRGDDAVARYVEALADLEPVFEPGLLHSYSNAGFVLLGRLVEHVLETTWDAALQEKVVKPLGLENTVTLPEDVAVRRFAIGHLTDAKDGTVKPVERFGANRASGPCGVISASVPDVLAFARFHLEGELKRTMWEPQVRLPRYSPTQAWGLGFELSWSGERLLPGHGGNVAGQTSDLVLIPDREAAVMVATSSDLGRMRAEPIVKRLLAERFGIDALPEVPSEPAEPPAVDKNRYLGEYVRVDSTLEIAEGEGGELELTIRPTRSYPPGGKLPDPTTLSLTAVEPDVFLARYPAAPAPITVVFTEQADGRFYLHAGLRAVPKAS